MGVHLTSKALKLPSEVDVESWRIKQLKDKYSNDKILGYNIYLHSEQNDNVAQIFIESSNKKPKTDKNNFIIIKSISSQNAIAPVENKKIKRIESLKTNGI